MYKNIKPAWLKKLCNAIVHIFGGITYDDVASDVGVLKDYWKHECVHTSIYVSQENCNEKYTESIEKELAHKLAEIMLKFGYISFMSRSAGDGDVQVMGQTHILTVKRPTPHHIPSRLKFDKSE